MDVEKPRHVTLVRIWRSNFCNHHFTHIAASVCPSARQPLSNPWANKFSTFQSVFLKVTISRPCNRAKFFWLCAKSWNLYAQTKNVRVLTSLQYFSLCFTHIMWFFVRFKHFFLRKISTLKFWPGKKIWWISRNQFEPFWAEIA